MSSRTFGPRFNAGYQFPRTNAAPIRRGDPIRTETLPNGAVIQIVPLLGSRERLFDVCAQHTSQATGDVHATTFKAHDELEATTEFRRLAAEYSRL